MIRKSLQYCQAQINNGMRYIKWLYEKDLYESVYFYTFHKCASSLFAGYVLKNVKGLRHIDYASKIYAGRLGGSAVFDNKGFVYGPLRLSLRSESPEYKLLVKGTCKPEFVRDKIVIFLIRDPRDILVSKYYSFGFTHGFSSDKEIRQMQQTVRNDVQGKSIDQYCMDEAHRTLEGFDTLRELKRSCGRSVVLKYEDMIENWDYFSVNLTKLISISDKVLTQVYKRTRPSGKEDITAHQRDGNPGAHRRKLREETIGRLNRTFIDIIDEYQYKP